MHQFGAGTHVGNVRDNNEDSYVCDEEMKLWMIADGMGGHGFGEVASAISSYAIFTQMRDGQGINQAIEFAHRQIKEFAMEASGTTMGTTLVLLFSQASLYNIFWVGDSRAYLYDGTLSQLTVDHSLVQSLIDGGELTEQEATFDPRRNGITKALGVLQAETVRADSISQKWYPNQKILLCSDGLTDCVDNAAIESILCTNNSDQEKVDMLIERALKAGGKDNITVIVVSAPGTVDDQEIDTQVPADVDDSTFIPSENDLSSDENRNRATGNSGTLQFNIPTLHERIDDIPSRTNPDASSLLSDSSPWLDSQKWLLALTLFVTIVLFARLTTSDKSENASRMFTTGALVEQQSQSNIPITRGDLPRIELPRPGQIIQIGIFSHLKGAERQQVALSEIGLLPYIEKKVAENDILYAVILGPFHDVSKKKVVIEILQAGKLSYFERTEVSY